MSFCREKSQVRRSIPPIIFSSCNIFLRPRTRGKKRVRNAFRCQSRNVWQGRGKVTLKDINSFGFCGGNHFFCFGGVDGKWLLA